MGCGFLQARQLNAGGVRRRRVQVVMPLHVNNLSKGGKLFSFLLL
jgi:hypothetical protein